MNSSNNVSIKFSSLQENIFSFVKNEKGNCIINAVAGSGKTFTLLHAMNYTIGSSLFCCFNKSIQIELSNKVPKNVECATLHSIGLKLLNKKFKRTKVDGRKVDYKMNEISGLSIQSSMDKKEMSIVYKKRNIIKQLVSYCKSNLTNYNSKENLLSIVDQYSIDFEEFSYDEIFNFLPSLFNKIIEDTYYVDFDDMIYLPVVYKINQLSFDNIFVDESQDLNRCQMELILQIGKPTSRYLIVGDPYQSIYGFRGADSSSMSKLKDILNAKEFPLSICYRCPSSHIELAQEIVTHITSKEDAISGKIENVKEDNFLTSLKDNAKKNPIVLCRINAPLVKWCLSCIGQGIKAIVKGRDIGNNLITIVKKFENFDTFEADIELYLQEEISKLSKRKNTENLIALLEDKVQAIKLISENCTSIYQIINKIENLFSDENIEGVNFSTVHKAKGLENDNVYILMPELLPLIRKNQKDWEKEQESNIKYVALTRSKENLYFVITKK